MDSARFLSDETRLKDDLWASESLIADSDDVSVWKFIRSLFVATLIRFLHLRVKI